MLIPKTDKWVLVRWHGGVRSVVKAKYLLKFLPPGEDLKISAVIKVGDSKDGKPGTATVLTSGNERHQLELLSEPGERTATSDEETPELEVDKNNKNEDSKEISDEASKKDSEDPEKESEDSEKDSEEDSGEDFEESSSDWNPGSSELDLSTTEESNSGDSDKDTNNKSKSPSESSPKNQNNKKKSEKLLADKQTTREVIAKTVDKLAKLYIGTDREMVRFEKKRRRHEAEKGWNNDNNRDESYDYIPLHFKKDNNKSVEEIVTYMNTMFLGLFKVIGSNDPDIKCPSKCKKVKVSVSEAGDVVIRDKKYHKKNKQWNKQEYSEMFDKTLTPYDTDDTSDNNNKNEVIAETMTSHESDDETLASISKKNSMASIKKKKTSGRCKDKESPKPFKDNRTPTPDIRTSTPDNRTSTPDNRTLTPNKRTSTPDNRTLTPNKRTSATDNRTSTPAENKKLAEASLQDDSSDCDYSSDRSDDPVLISNKYETVNTSHKKIDAEWIPIGSGTTLIHKDKFAQVNWKSYTMATRSLLRATFSRRTLATHSLTGKKSPAFSHKPAKMCLDPKIVSDIVIEVGDKFKVRDNLVRNIITTKCADECKMRKMKKAKKEALKAKLAQATNDNNDVENNDEENVPSPKKTKFAKKKKQKCTSPRRRKNRMYGKKNIKKITKRPKKKIQENITPEENDINKRIHTDNQEDIPPTYNETIKCVPSKNGDTTLSSDDDAMVIDEEYIPPSEDTTLKSIENKNQENTVPENTRISNNNYGKFTTPSINMRKRSENLENFPPLENNASKSFKYKSQENIPPPVKRSIKGYKTYKNKSKVK